MLTRGQVKKLYGDTKMKFSSYFKYTFIYKGESEDGELTLSFGGMSEDIYRCSLDAEHALKELLDESNAGVSLLGETIYEAFDY